MAVGVHHADRCEGSLVRRANDGVAARVGDDVSLTIAEDPHRVAVDVCAVGVGGFFVGYYVGEQRPSALVQLAGHERAEERAVGAELRAERVAAAEADAQHELLVAGEGDVGRAEHLGPNRFGAVRDRRETRQDTVVRTVHADVRDASGRAEAVQTEGMLRAVRRAWITWPWAPAPRLSDVQFAVRREGQVARVVEANRDHDRLRLGRGRRSSRDREQQSAGHRRRSADNALTNQHCVSPPVGPRFPRPCHDPPPANVVRWLLGACPRQPAESTAILRTAQALLRAHPPPLAHPCQRQSLPLALRLNGRSEDQAFGSAIERS